MITIRDLDFYFGDKAIFKNLSLDIPDGVTVIEGPSGGGKTTLLRLIAGLLTPDKGTIEGVPSPVSFMFQEDRLFPWYTVGENIALTAPRGDKSAVQHLLEELELSNLSESLPENISGGQKRRTALARTLIHGGKLLILDEPLKGLDPDLTKRIVSKIKDRGVSIIVTSHSEFETELWDGNRIFLPELHITD